MSQARYNNQIDGPARCTSRGRFHSGRRHSRTTKHSHRPVAASGREPVGTMNATDLLLTLVLAIGAYAAWAAYSTR